MPHALSINVPDEVFAHLSEIAIQRAGDSGGARRGDCVPERS